MQTFADWLRYYNNLDVAPGLEALQKMRNFYTEKGIDILKDAVSVPGVSLHYLLRGAVERNAELYSPGKEAYDMLKEAVVGGPSLVFTRLHEAGVTGIRSHQIAEPRLCKNILGYDANALYLSTMLKEMPCGKERVVQLRRRVPNRGGSCTNAQAQRRKLVRVCRSRYRDSEALAPKVRGNVSVLLQQSGSG